jgi:hypothetical protein
VTVPCEVHYYKDTEGPGETEVADDTDVLSPGDPEGQ